MTYDPREHPVRISRMKAMSRSAAHYFAACEGNVDSPSLPMRFGTLGHALLWPDVAPPYAVYDRERRGNAWKEFLAAHPGVEIFTAKEVGKASRVAEAIDRHPDAGALVRLGKPEQTIPWLYNGREALSRLDVTDLSTVVELKTCQSSHPDRFVRAGIGMGYHAQVAFYRLSVAFLTGRAPCSIPVVIVAVESAKPHVVTVFELRESDLREGEKLCRAWIERILVCEAANHWPGYVETRVPFHVPDPEAEALTFDDDDVTDDEDESEAA